METDTRGNPDPEGDTARRAELDGRGQFPQADREHEAKERISASDGRGLLPALSPRNKAPVGTGPLQARLSGRETSPDRQRESAAHALGTPQRRIKGFIGGWDRGRGRKGEEVNNRDSELTLDVLAKMSFGVSAMRLILNDRELFADKEYFQRKEILSRVVKKWELLSGERNRLHCPIRNFFREARPDPSLHLRVCETSGQTMVPLNEI